MNGVSLMAHTVSPFTAMNWAIFAKSLMNWGPLNAERVKNTWFRMIRNASLTYLVSQMRKVISVAPVVVVSAPYGISGMQESPI